MMEVTNPMVNTQKRRLMTVFIMGDAKSWVIDCNQKKARISITKITEHNSKMVVRENDFICRFFSIFFYP